MVGAGAGTAAAVRGAAASGLDTTARGARRWFMDSTGRVPAAPLFQPLTLARLKLRGAEPNGRRRRGLPVVLGRPLRVLRSIIIG